LPEGVVSGVYDVFADFQPLGSSSISSNERRVLFNFTMIEFSLCVLPFFVATSRRWFWGQRISIQFVELIRVLTEGYPG
jgi:hypothetical protein